MLGGTRGFSDVVWKVTKYEKSGSSPQIVFSYRSFDGEEGENENSIVRSHIGWRGERNIPYKGVKTSP